jgi:GH15 family glucan-1,4-alpha-glucosidase
LLCSFWLADNWAFSGQRDKAIAMFERLLTLRNDVGLLSEEYDPVARRFLGNFPQALSHVALVNTAYNLLRTDGRTCSAGPRELGIGSVATGVR